ncbi:MAG: hypothetical protein AB2L14_02635 [Candidatus Xenobiia bacterium LiM19]
MEQIISIIRENRQLYVLKVRRAGDFVIPVPVEEPEKASVLPEYEITKTALEEIPESLLPQKKRLIASWAEISRCLALDSDTVHHLLTVLLETRASFSEGGMLLPDLVPAGQEQTFRATAAHPRAYRGTKSRPPKPRQHEPLDLRLYIDTAHNQNKLLSDSETHLQKALELLNRDGYDRERLAFISSVAGRVEPYLAYHHGITDGAALEMPVLFSSHLLPLLKGQGSEAIRKYLSLFHALNLEQRPDLLPVFLMIVSLEPGEFVSGWAGLIASQKPERQAELACYLIESGIAERNPGIFTADDLARFNGMTSEDIYSHRLYYLLSALAEGSSGEYLFSGFHLANSFNPSYRFDSIGDCKDFPLEQAEELALYMDSGSIESYNHGRYCSMSIWESCGRLKGLQRLIRKLPWQKLSPEIARSFVNMLKGFRYDDLDDEQLAGKSDFIFEKAPSLFETVCRIASPWQEKFIDSVRSLHWHWDGEDIIDKRYDELYALSERLSQRPFSEETIITDELLELFDANNREQQDGIINAQDNSFRQLEKACRRDNDARCINKGLHVICEKASGFILSCFLHFPAFLFKVAKLLGTLSLFQRYQVMKYFVGHIFMTTDWDRISAGEALEILQPFIDEGLTNPMPGRLRDWLAGSVKLSEQQREKYMQMMRVKIVQTKLDLLEHIARRNLAAGLSIDVIAPDLEHALQMINLSNDNRRAFRRFLKALLEGRDDYILTHPLTVRWLSKHPALNVELWSNGICTSERLEEIGSVTLSLERDPLEALKLGTHVGSCLGLGGGLTYSALAVVLDFNKQVIYARDDRGRMLARQLVAISEEDRLVCFEVYPLSAHQRLRQLFREYDRRFAESLGIPLYKSEKEDEYTVARILSHYWWDDGPWQLKENRSG